MINYITSYMINYIQLRQFNIITYFEVDLSFIIYHLIYLIIMS